MFMHQVLDYQGEYEVVNLQYVFDHTLVMEEAEDSQVAVGMGRGLKMACTQKL